VKQATKYTLWGIGAVAMYVGCVILGIAIMINGWGITPANWWWIIGGAALAPVITAFGHAMARRLP